MSENQQEKENRQGVNLRLQPPEGDKHQMIVFQPRTEEESDAYNEAIQYYTQEKKLDVFCQMSEFHPGGIMGWEIWDDKGEDIKKLLPEIERDAEILLSGDSNKVDELYSRWYPE